MAHQTKILVAGATGYLGLHLVKALQEQKQDFVALARNEKKLSEYGLTDQQIRVAQITEPDSLSGCCDHVDVVISCIGITRQRDGLGYMDVDYQGNLNLLKEAQRAGVKKFIYISALNAPKYQEVRLLQAKEKFAQRLLASETLTPCVIRPNGFFSDMTEIFNMAKRGRAFLFGDGSRTLNPIHGRDLAHFVLQAMYWQDRELNVGGPHVVSQKEAVEMAFRALGTQSKITFIADKWRTRLISLSRKLPEKWGGPFEFFLTVSGNHMLAPTYGSETLEGFYRQLAGKGESHITHPSHHHGGDTL